MITNTDTSKYEGHTPEGWKYLAGGKGYGDSDKIVGPSQQIVVEAAAYDMSAGMLVINNPFDFSLIINSPQILRERDEARELLGQCTELVDLFIATTPTSEGRNNLTELNIKIRQAIGWEIDK